MSISIVIEKVDTKAMRTLMNCYESCGGYISTPGGRPREVQLADKASRYARELRDNRNLPDRFGVVISQTLTSSYLVHVQPNERFDTSNLEREMLKYFPAARK